MGGAGGLSVEALEDVIDWREQFHNAQAARAELAALVAAAGQVGPLRAALGGLLGGIVREARVPDSPSLVRATHTLRAVDEAIAALLADAGPGAAGARDETITALTKVAQIVVDCRDLLAGEFRDRWGVVTWADYYDKLTALADAALDALRDGGAG
jgi:hypothetical protein